MKHLMRISGRFLAKSFLVMVALSLVLLAVVQIILLIAINALNTGKAHDFIQQQLTAALVDSGYNATFDHLFYDPVRGFTLYHFAISDKDGQMATVDRFSINIAYSKIFLRRLDVVASAGEIKLVRLPASEEKGAVKTDKEPLQSFSLPNIYFKHFKISHFNIAHLDIDPAISGTALSFSPHLRADISLDPQVAADISLSPHAAQKIGQIAFPERLEIQARFDPSALSFSLDHLSVASPDFTVSGKGTGYLTANGNINLDVKAVYPDLRQLTAENFQSADLSVVVDGTYAHPAMHIQGTVIPDALKQKGLADIQISATASDLADDLKGNIAIETSYLEKTMNLGAVFHYNAPVLTIESLTGKAPLIDMSGSGVVSTVDSIFDGKLMVTASDLSYYKDLLSMDIAGTVKADVVLSPLNALQSVAIKASAGHIKIDTIQVGKADIEAQIKNVEYPWPNIANIQIENLDLSPDISLAQAQLVMKELGNESYQLSLNGQGFIPSAVAFKGSADISDFTKEFPTIRHIDLKTTLGKSSVVLSGGVDPQAVDLHLITKNFRGADLPTAPSPALSTLLVNGDIDVTGASSSPVTKAHVTISGLKTGAYKDLHIAADVNNHSDKVMVAVGGSGSGIKVLKANSEFPLTFSLWPFAFYLNMDAPLSGDVLADIDMGAISALFIPPTQEFSANLKANGSIGGKIGEPSIKGTLALRNGQFTDDQNGIALRSIAVNSSFTNDSVTFDSITATDGEKGLIKGSGHVGFAEDAKTDLSLSMKDFHLPKSNLADGMVDATISVANTGENYAVNGAVDIAHMNIIVPETFQSKIPELNIVDRRKDAEAISPLQTVMLSLKVNAPNQIFVRGWGLDAEFGGELDISGDAASPQFNGTFSSKRGRYEEFGKRFTLERANLRFQGEMPPSPYLDIIATIPADDVTASIILAGPVTLPAITFSSTPALPQDEVLSRLLFGRDTAKITPFQAIQLAQTLARFSGKGGGSSINPLGLLRSVTGLDDISIDTDANGETNVGVGKYLTDKVYLEFEKGKAPGSGAANIQIEVTPSVNIQSEIGQDAQTGGGVFWKHDY
ncbi:MAG TPA: hypothetical protein DCM27_03415 [Rhodospirillaceae bacterium]|nr:hypothetical protein [Rhodospirillaceae bacterium]